MFILVRMENSILSKSNNYKIYDKYTRLITLKLFSLHDIYILYILTQLIQKDHEIRSAIHG